MQTPFSKELFTVGAKARGICRNCDFLRGHSCEATIAKTKCKLIAIPLVEIKRLADTYPGFKNNIEKVESICEKAYALAAYARQMNKPPLDGKKWIIDKFKEKGQQKVRILSKDFDIKGWKTGMELKKEDLEKLDEENKNRLRYIEVFVNEQTWREESNLVRESGVEYGLKMQADMVAVGLKEADKEVNSHKLKIIRGKEVLINMAKNDVGESI